MQSPLCRWWVIASLAVLVAGPALAAEPPTIRLWPGKSPGEQGPVDAEKIDAPRPGQSADVQRVTNVSEPTLTVFPAPRDEANGAGLIIAPGGGYRILAWDLEGEEVARWFNGAGVTCFLLKYRVPQRSHDPENRLPLMDAQRAVSLVRARAREWGVDPARIGFLGFSAGGHLAANLENNADRRAYEAVDDADRSSCRPDFAVLIYPGGLLDRADPTRLAPELRLSAETPPTFIAVAADDRGSVESSLRYFQALRAAGNPSELHVYAAGGHGFGLRPRAGAAAGWPARCVEWLRTVRMLAPAAVGAQAAPPEAPALTRLLTDIYAAIRNKDEAFLNRALIEDHLIVQRSGAVKTRAEWLAELRSGDTSFTLLEVQEPRVRVHGDTAIVTYLTRARGKIAGKAFDGTSRTTRVFVRRDGRWQSVSVQYTTTEGR